MFPATFVESGSVATWVTVGVEVALMVEGEECDDAMMKRMEGEIRAVNDWRVR